MAQSFSPLGHFAGSQQGATNKTRGVTVSRIHSQFGPSRNRAVLEIETLFYYSLLGWGFKKRMWVSNQGTKAPLCRRITGRSPGGDSIARTSNRNGALPAQDSRTN